MEAQEFCEALAAGMPASRERLILCGFLGDPNTVGLHAWKPRAWAPGDALPFNARCNVYATVSSFFRAEDGSWRRRQDHFSAGRALMVDDVGTKVPHSVLDRAPPSALVETSPGNFQAWYFMKEAQRDRAAFDQLIRAFIAQKLCGADPGMAGVNRVGRVPGFINGKAKYGGSWRCALRSLSGRRWSPEELVEAFGLELRGTRETGLRRLKPESAEILNRAHIFNAQLTWLHSRGMVKRAEFDPSGWMQLRCPWLDQHTDRADTGAAIRQPDDDNGWHGAFRCHHGHCADKNWSALTDWINEHTTEELEAANRTET